MLRMHLIGCGAAGNKAVINFVQSGYMNNDKYDYLLVNSTDKDIPAEYRANSMIFGNNSIGGCSVDLISRPL